jgi:hypothetical protein
MKSCCWSLYGNAVNQKRVCLDAAAQQLKGIDGWAVRAGCTEPSEVCLEPEIEYPSKVSSRPHFQSPGFDVINPVSQRPGHQQHQLRVFTEIESFLRNDVMGASVPVMF